MGTRGGRGQRRRNVVELLVAKTASSRSSNGAHTHPEQIYTHTSASEQTHAVGRWCSASWRWANGGGGDGDGISQPAGNI